MMIGLVLFTILVLAAFFRLARKPVPQNGTSTDTATVHIIIDNPKIKKEQSTERDSIIREAETLFVTLQKKYLYSPMPYKVMGDFYAGKGLPDKALEKYASMIRYLNTDLSLEKLEPVLHFLREHDAKETVSEIEAYYGRT